MQHHNWSLEEIENMIPWERDIYLGLLLNYIKEEKERQEKEIGITNLMDALTPNAAAVEITEFLLPYIGMVMIVIIGFMIKDFATKFSKGLAFQLNKQFQEGDHVLIDGERALIVKIGISQTVFGVTKSGGELDGDYVWRYVPNERIDFLKIEKIIFDQTPINNSTSIKDNSNRIEEIQNGKD